MNRRILLVVLTVAVLVVVASISVYVLTRPLPIPLTVTEGSTTGVIEGNFVNYPWTNATIVRYFNATTYANQSGGPTSVLTLRLLTSTFYDGRLGLVMVGIHATIQGEFASDLRPSGLTLTCNQTGNFAAGQFAWGYAEPGPTNVSYDPGHPRMVSFTTEPVTFTPTLLNQTGDGPFYEFVFPAFLMDQDPLGYNAFVGLRATVTGPFTPAVSVGILLQIIDVPA